MFERMPEEIKKFIEEQEKEHTPEKLMEKATAAVEEILPEHMYSTFFVPKENDSSVTCGSALCGGIQLFGVVKEEAMNRLLHCAMELTCQAIVAEKWKEAEQQK